MILEDFVVQKLRIQDLRTWNSNFLNQLIFFYEFNRLILILMSLTTNGYIDAQES